MKNLTTAIAITLLTFANLAQSKTYEAPIPVDFPKPEAITIFCFEGVLYISNSKGMTHAVDRMGKPLSCQQPKS